MSNGTFKEFFNALLAFESGWDRARYEQGAIQDWQLTEWARGTVEELFLGSDYTSWGDLTDSEWEMMAYKSMNSLGFVGYQFGEALLIDLGYYEDDFYYGSGASKNTWDGTWTGKNGVDSFKDFATKEAQEVTIIEAFGHNLQFMDNYLTQHAESLDSFIGTTKSYNDNGQTITVDITLTGILAAAHLRGHLGVINLLLNDSVTTDEYGTSILQYMEQFGGYDSSTIDEMIEYYKSRLTDDEGLGDNGGADVDETTADVVITWNFGSNPVVTNFDADNGTIFISWLSPEYLEISEYESDGTYGLIFSIPSNEQTISLEGVRLSDLSKENFTILDSDTAKILFDLIAQSKDTDDVIIGTNDADTITSLAGNDTVYAYNDNDFVTTGTGNDYIDGGAGNDTIYSGSGSDTIWADIAGTAGNDVVDSGAGDDFIYGGTGHDSMSGGDDADYIDGDTGNDTINGGNGNDLLYGRWDNDVINGGNGNDSMFGGLQDDTLNGDDGEDYIDGGDGADTFNGGAGNDRLYGNLGNDIINGDAGNDSLYGGLGHDSFEGGDGEDYLEGGSGNDILRGGDGNDYISSGQDNDLLYGDLGNDTLAGNKGNDNITGGDGADFFIFFSSDGIDVINDFNAAAGDTIQFEGVFSSAAAAKATITYSGSNIVFNTNSGNSITLTGVTSIADSDIAVVN